MVYRSEIKHEISLADKFSIISNLRAVAQPDPHAGADGKYRIRSLYFDDWRDRALREKIDGVNEREKFRLRLYQSGDVNLEKKVKRGGLGYKVTAPVTRQEAQRIVSGDTFWMATSGRALLIELYARMRCCMLTFGGKTGAVDEMRVCHTERFRALVHFRGAERFRAVKRFSERDRCIVCAADDHAFEQNRNGLRFAHVEQYLRSAHAGGFF